jgi:hypothetical protein
MTKVKAYCNMCGFETMRDNKGDSCPYHQQISYSEDGEVSFRYDEFNQDGEEW